MKTWAYSWSGVAVAQLLIEDVHVFAGGVLQLLCEGFTTRRLLLS